MKCKYNIYSMTEYVYILLHLYRRKHGRASDFFFFMVKFLKISFKKNPQWSRPGSNRRPSACKADVITTTLRDQIRRRWLIVRFEFEVENINLIYT